MRGIWTFLCKNRAKCVETVDLIAEAAQHQGPLEIIVDFCAMRDDIWENIARVLAGPPYSNPYLTLPVGEYELIYNIVRHILEQLKAAGLKLTFVFDCLKISNEEDQHVKHERWLSRLTINLTEQNEMMMLLNKPKFNFQDTGHVSKLPWFDCLLRGLIKEMEFECYAPHGQESDFYRAELQRQRNAFAVLSSDTDYVLFPDCPVILWQMFDEQHDLNYSPHFETPVVVPRKLICGRIVSTRVWKFLQLSSHDQFIDVTSVFGNLFTAPFVNVFSLFESLRLPYAGSSRFHTVAQFIRRNPSYISIEECPEVMNKVQQRSEFHEACVKAREYYNLRSDPLRLNAKTYANDPILAFLATQENMLRLGDWPSRIHCRTYWPFALMEEHRIISHQEALMRLLCRIFAFVHKRPEETSVNVYFRAHNSAEIGQSLVQPVASGDGSTVEEIMSDNVTGNMMRFAEIMNCYRANTPNRDADWLCDMLNPNDFMRAFLVYCWRMALDVEPENGYFTNGGNLLALTTSMLTLWDPEAREEVMPLLEQLYGMRIVPTPSQVTIFNWMQFICVTANDVALFLYLERFLDPLLPRMFSLSLFLAYVNIKDLTVWSQPELRASLETVQRNVMLTYSSLLGLVPVPGVANI